MGHARRLVRGALHDWGLDEHVPALELAVSELVSNAIVHGVGPVEVELSRGDDEVRLEVADAGGGEPVLRPSATAEARVGGWGLGLVDSVADDWGAANDASRTTVWLVRRTAPPPSGRPAAGRPAGAPRPRGANGHPGRTPDASGRRTTRPS